MGQSISRDTSTVATIFGHLLKDDERKRLHILIMGETGVGKSTLGNALLNNLLFRVESGPLPGSTYKYNISHQQKSINGVEVHGYDTRGYFDGKVKDEDITAAINAERCKFDIILVCMKFNSRFGDNGRKMCGILSSMSNVWNKVVIALTYADAIPAECQQLELADVNEWFDQNYAKWKGIITKYLTTELKVDSGLVDAIPIITTSHEKINPKHGNLRDKSWLQILLYEVASRACCSPKVVLALASAVNPARFITMIAYKIDKKIPKTEDDIYDLIIEFLGVEAVDKIMSELCKLIEVPEDKIAEAEENIKHLDKEKLKSIVQKFREAVKRKQDGIVAVASIGGAIIGAGVVGGVGAGLAVAGAGTAGLGTISTVAVVGGAALLGVATGAVVGAATLMVVVSFFCWVVGTD